MNVQMGKQNKTNHWICDANEQQQMLTRWDFLIYWNLIS